MTKALLTGQLQPCIWHSDTGAAAAAHYLAAFSDAEITSESPIASPEEVPTVITMRLHNLPLMLLSAGPMHRPNPSVSIMIKSADEAELRRLWDMLSQNAQAFYFPLAQQPWSQLYGWVGDQWGFTWQLNFDDTMSASAAPVLTIALLFTNQHFGKAGTAMDRYLSLLPAAREVVRQTHTEGPLAGTVLYAELESAVGNLVLMDGPDTHAYAFDEGVSLLAHCDDQPTIDLMWDSLIEGGGMPHRCGWLRDAFGLWWQIVPTNLSKIFADPTRGPAAMQAMMGMSKIEILGLG